MSAVTVIWLMMAGASLTLALVHLSIWFAQRDQQANLAFSSIAVGVAAFAMLELAAMTSQTIPQYALRIRLAHIPAWIIVVSMVWFTRVYLRAGRLWLGLTVCAMRTTYLAITLLPWVNVNYRHIDALVHRPLLGQQVAVAVGTPNPLMAFGQFSVVLLTVFFIDASIQVWRRGDHRRAITVGASMSFFSAQLLAIWIMVFWQVLRTPIASSWGYLLMLIAMGYELSRDVLHAAQLAGRLRESESRFRIAVEGSPNAIVMADPQGAIALINSRSERLLGYSAAELIGQPVEMLVPERMRSNHSGLRAKFMSAPMSQQIGSSREIAARRKDGTEFPVEINLNPIGTDEGIFVLCGIVDLSAQRYSEVEINELRERLSHFGRVSTMGQLASALAHEINQPLGAILRNAEAAELVLQGDSPDLDELRAIITDIMHDDHRAGEVIDRLRRLLKHRRIDLRPVALEGVLDEAIGLMQAYADARQVKLQIDLAPPFPRVQGDRVHLQQVLLNLLLNAMDAVDGQDDPRRRIVTVSAHCNGDESVEVAVSDHGHGIESDRLSQIFEPFYSTKSDGMGMGLPISRTIIEAHGGQIRGENNVNGQGGATIRFTLKSAEGKGVAL